MDELDVIPQEISKAAEGAERVAVQELDDATYEPRTYVEQAGDHQQAEVIQNDLTTVVETVINQAASAEGVAGPGNPQDGGASPGGTSNTGNGEHEALPGHAGSSDIGGGDSVAALLRTRHWRPGGRSESGGRNGRPASGARA